MGAGNDFFGLCLFEYRGGVFYLNNVYLGYG